MLQITEQQVAAGLGARWPTAHRCGDPAAKPSNPENGLSDLLREFLGRLSTDGIDLDHADPRPPLGADLGRLHQGMVHNWSSNAVFRKLLLTFP